MAISKAKLAAIAAGVCAECHTARPAEGRKRCPECLAYVAMRERERRARLRDECPKKRKAAKQRVRKLLETGQISYVTVSGYRPARKPRKNPLAVGGRVRGLRLAAGD